MRLIAGMHRSGTSLVTRICHLAGADLGNAEEFHPADRWNPDGYFEQSDILSVNLTLVNGRWGRLAYLRLPSDRTVRSRAVPLQDRMQTIIRKYEHRTVKENRFCLTLPAWLDLGLNLEKTLIVFRDPAAVARSLWRRNRLPPLLSYGLWEQHFSRLIKAVAGRPHRYLWYDGLVRHGDVDHAAASLAWLQSQSSDAVAEEIRQCVKPAPRPLKPGRFEPRSTRHLYNDLIERASSQS